MARDGISLAVVLHPKLNAGEAINASSIALAGLKSGAFLDPLTDAQGCKHVAVTNSVVILKSKTGSQLASLAKELSDHSKSGTFNEDGLKFVCFSKYGQELHDRYDEYRQGIVGQSTDQLEVIAIALAGEEDEVKKLTRKFSIYK